MSDTGTGDTPTGDAAESGAADGDATEGDAAKARTAAVFDRASATYDQVGVDFFSLFGARLVEVAGVGPGDRVLDIGSGRGAVLFPAARAVAPGGSVLGIDLAEGMVRRCAEEARSLGLDEVEVRLGDAERPDVPASGFDAVLAGLVLFFLPDPGAALDAYRVALRPGGRLTLSSFGPEDRSFESVFGSVAAHIPTPEDSPTPTSPARAQDGPFSSDERITELLSAHGFTEVGHLVEQHDIEFDDAEQWIAWSWSHGARTLWEMVPEERRAAAHADAVTALDALAGDGPLVHRWQLRYTTAVAS